MKIYKLFFFSCFFVANLAAQNQVTEKPNVLFIAIDDLNDWVGVFGGNPQVKTPNLDKLNAQGAMVMAKAQSPATVCGPSRSAILTGKYPSNTGVYGNTNNLKNAPKAKDLITLPEYFANHGYHTISMGKIFHKHPIQNSTEQDEGQWAFNEWNPSKGGVGPISSKRPVNGLPNLPNEDMSSYHSWAFDWGPTKGNDEKKMKDYITAKWAAEQLMTRDFDGKPFFMAIGFSKPHLQWYVPQKYFDMYPLDKIILPETKSDDLEDILNKYGKQAYSPGDSWQRAEKYNRHKEAVQAYLATITFVDECIGVLMDGLNSSKYANNTIIMLWGDHGWHLGEKQKYGKTQLWQEATRVPFMVKVPGITKSNSKTDGVVNLIDMYPTLLELCGLPKNPANDGKSFAKLLKKPTMTWNNPTLTTDKFEAHRIYDGRFSYIIERKNGAEQLYDHLNDPMEFKNLIFDPKYNNIKEKLKTYLPKVNEPEGPKNKKMKIRLVKKSIQLYLIIVGYFIYGQTNYQFWPTYQHLELKDLDTITPQKWIDKDHVIKGWDWSFPNYVSPSKKSLVGLQRIIGLNKKFEPINLQFKSNSIGILWVKWRDIEPTEGNYNFQPIIDRIKQANSVGSDIILRILCHSKSRGNGPKAIEMGEAPLWLEKYGINLLPKKTPKHNLNFDPSHPEFHKRYLKLINELSKTEISKMVKAAYVGYASHSFGDEGIGPYAEKESKANDTVQHVRERLDAWHHAFKGMEHKIFMGGPIAYGFQKGFGVRRGFVEMYMYNVPDENLGQYIDDNGYLLVDEKAPILKNNAFNGEVNEEYEPAWATEDRDFRFGKSTESYPYRYFTSTLRALQMRCTYIHTTGHLVPKMLPFIAQELGRTIEDTPDVWALLRTSYIKSDFYKNNDYKNRVISAVEQKEGIETKNFERWLYQRDSPGYETEPAIKVEHPIKMWMIQDDKRYDFIARKGTKIGFNIDDRWEVQKQEKQLAIKITYFDNDSGKLILRYKTKKGILNKEQVLQNDGALKTVTFFINGLINNSAGNGYDFILENKDVHKTITVTMVRIIK